MEINRLKLYQTFDYIPVFSMFTNTAALVAKGVFSSEDVAARAESTTVAKPLTFKAYAKKKDSLRCFVLIFLPIISNIF